MSDFLSHSSADMSVIPRRDDLLSRTEQTSPVIDRRWTDGDLLPVVFLSVAGAASVVWIGAIGWTSWRLINWVIS
ncbi:hypothetical protein BKD09_14920 [Bradyrhizobium japonicum]|uniref:Uncharacterized protein n=1 Tax=Bradyrhizobium japonicum TaxID=375 RepID=A0A1L3F8L7_BRAJP|nr:hypothetical protein BKD09_14920 [Bradyrhizobium japonicum]